MARQWVMPQQGPDETDAQFRARLEFFNRKSSLTDQADRIPGETDDEYRARLDKLMDLSSQITKEEEDWLSKQPEMYKAWHHKNQLPPLPNNLYPNLAEQISAGSWLTNALKTTGSLFPAQSTSPLPDYLNPSTGATSNPPGFGLLNNIFANANQSPASATPPPATTTPPPVAVPAPVPTTTQTTTTSPVQTSSLVNAITDQQVPETEQQYEPFKNSEEVVRQQKVTKDIYKQLMPNLLNTVLPGLGSLLGGGIAQTGGSLLQGALKQIITPGGASGGFTSASAKAISELGPLLQQLAINRNAMGQSGQQAAYGARTAMANQGPTAQAVGTATQMRNEAGRALSEGQNAYTNAARNTQLQSRGLVNQLGSIAGNVPLSATTEAIKAIGEQTSNANQQSMGNAAQIAQQGRSISGGLLGNAENVLDTSAKTQFVTKVQPYLNEWDTSAVAPAAQLGSTAGSYKADELNALIPTNPLEGLAGGLGELGTGALGRYNYGKAAPLSVIGSNVAEQTSHQLPQDKPIPQVQPADIINNPDWQQAVDAGKINIPMENINVNMDQMNPYSWQQPRANPPYQILNNTTPPFYKWPNVPNEVPSYPMATPFYQWGQNNPNSFLDFLNRLSKR